MLSKIVQHPQPELKSSGRNKNKKQMNILQHLHDTVVPNARNSYKPLALKHRPLSLYVGLLISVKILSLLSIGLIPQTSAASALSVANVLALTNSSRKGYNLVSLKENAFLDAAAQAKANDMVASGYFAHLSPAGKTPWDFIKAQGYNYSVAGENLAINFYSAEGVENAWMNSPGHKANILNKDFKDIGVGIVQGTYKGNPAVFVVQMFGSPSYQNIVWKDSYTFPEKMIQHAVALPEAKMIALAEPQVLSTPYTLQNGNEYKLSGSAPAADTVFVLVNNQAIASFPVVAGKFNGELNLQDGANAIQVVSYYNNLIASSLSDKFVVQVDSSAPVISDTQLDDGSIIVQVQGSPTKVVATAGESSVMLQPTLDPNKWVGKFESSDISGKIVVRATDLAGNISVQDAATITPNISENYGFAAPVHVSFGDSIYLYFFIGLLALLGLAIGIKKDVQHLGLIAHTSAVAVFALLLWVT